MIGRTTQEARFFLGDKGMNNGFETPQAFVVTEDATGQCLAIDGAVSSDAGKYCFDRADRRATSCQ